ncbi:MAG: hypothetical protein Q9M29_02055 [Mariprofundaceae bacterium]|nr:hypothetical protein [Mariprofundaceae bacterium]
MSDENKGAQDARKLLETVSFELDTDLRLHPQRLELGKADLLTDALTLPFTDIEKRLAQYIAGSSPAETEHLRKSMKNYLARLNSNPLIPLHFRMKVLNRFERELELFDAEMTAAVLNAHKIGVGLVQKAARTQPTYYRVLVDMVSNALELAVKLLRLSLEQYQAPAVIATRQVFDLARLGLTVMPTLGEEAAAERARLCKAVASHEFLRMLDFYGKSHSAQKMAWQELQHHIGILEPRFCRKGEAPPAIADSTILVTNMSRPNDAAKVVSKLPASMQTDAIIIPIDAFVDRLVTAIDRVESVLHSADKQKSDLHTEEALHTTIIGGNAILDTLRTKDRVDERKDYAGSRVILNWDAAKAIVESHTALVMSDYEYAPSERSNVEAWSVVNINAHGCGLERLHYEPLDLGVGALIGLSWIPHKGEPMLGIIRWIKEPKPGEQLMGVEFFKGKYKLVKGAMLGGGSEDMTEKRAWPLLIRPGKKYHTVLFPESRIFKKMTFVLSHEGRTGHFQVLEVVEAGPNYSLCKIGLARELSTSQEFDFSQ